MIGSVLVLPCVGCRKDVVFEAVKSAEVRMLRPEAGAWCGFVVHGDLLVLVAACSEACAASVVDPEVPDVMEEMPFT